MNIEVYFSTDYYSARKKILHSASAINAELQSFELPGHIGENGEPLAMDVILLGNKNARRVLMLSSGVHGVEGLYGSACQTAFIEQKLHLQLPKDCAVLIIHAVNPFGFAHCRRWNEDNVDINRNFIDFSLPVEKNTFYADIHSTIFAKSSNTTEFLLDNKLLDECITGIGIDEFVSRIVLGQRTNPDGLFYAGSKPSWSNQTFRKIIDRYLSAVEELIFIDLHTGVGDFGQSTVLYMPGLDNNFSQSKNVFEQAVDPTDGSIAAIDVDGEIVFAFNQLIDRLSRFVPVTLEVGTFPTIDLIELLCIEQLLYQRQGNRLSDEYLQARRSLQDAYFCDNLIWKESAITGFFGVFKQVLDAFSNQD